MDGQPIRPEWIDEIVCKFSMNFGHAFTEEELEQLVLSLKRDAEIERLREALTEVRRAIGTGNFVRAHDVVSAALEGK